MKVPFYLSELIELSGFDPSQPREPAGGPGGGQWTSGGASGATDKDPPKTDDGVFAIPRHGDGMGRLSFTTIKGDGFELSPARYAKGKVLIRTEDDNGFMTRQGRLANKLGNGHAGYSNREKGWVVSPSAAEKFQRYVRDGWDANSFNGELRPPEKKAA